MEHHLAVLGVHHQRKGAADDVLDTISGSTGLTGVADAVYVLQRETRQRADGILAIESRDFESEPAGLGSTRPRCAGATQDRRRWSCSPGSETRSWRR